MSFPLKKIEIKSSSLTINYNMNVHGLMNEFKEHECLLPFDFVLRRNEKLRELATSIVKEYFIVMMRDDSIFFSLIV